MKIDDTDDVKIFITSGGKDLYGSSHLALGWWIMVIGVYMGMCLNMEYNALFLQSLRDNQLLISPGK